MHSICVSSSSKCQLLLSISFQQILIEGLSCVTGQGVRTVNKMGAELTFQWQEIHNFRQLLVHENCFYPFKSHFSWLLCLLPKCLWIDLLLYPSCFYLLLMWSLITQFNSGCTLSCSSFSWLFLSLGPFLHNFLKRTNSRRK
jgi:hypothetical protein